MSGPYCCPICYKASIGAIGGHVEFTGDDDDGGGGEPIGKAGNVQQKFFKLLRRYLGQEGLGNGAGKPTSFPFPLEEFMEINLVCCEECHRLMESFCDLYHDMKRIELLLNWKVGTLMRIMKSAKRVPTRMSYFHDCIRNSLESDEGSRGSSERIIVDVTKSTRSLIKQCSKKLKTAFPLLSISKQDAGDAAVGQVIGNTVGEDVKTSSSRHDQHILDLNLEESPKDAPNLPTISNELLTSHTSVANQYSPLDPENIVDGSSTLEALASTPNPTLTVNVQYEEISQKKVTSGVVMSVMVNDATETKLNNHRHATPDSADGDPIISPSPQTFLKREEASVSSSSEEHQNCLISVETGNSIQAPQNAIGTQIISTEADRTQWRLRSSYRCPNCRKTFSLQAKLQSHMEEAHSMETSDEIEEEGDNDNVSKTEQLDESDSDSMGWSSSTSESESENDIKMPVDALEPETEGNTQKEIQQQVTVNTETRGQEQSSSSRKRNVNKIARRRNRKFGKIACLRYRLKCPDCALLFKDVKSILLHRRDSESCAHLYDPTSSFRVEVLVPPVSKRGLKFEDTDEISNFTSVFLVIDLPQEIYICDSCDLAVYSREDMEAHNKLHGSFPCAFCDVVESYAPNISKHELKHSDEQGKNDSNKSIYCPKCDFVCSNSKQYISTSYVHHHLQTHLSLTLNEPECPICKTSRKDMSGNAGFNLNVHLKTQHDLSDISDPQEKIICTINNCKAYFLSGSQLRHHRRIRHGIVGPPAKGLGRLGCKDCNETFSDPKNLRNHRVRVHLKSDKAIPCSVAKCKRVFESRKDLERHIRWGTTYHKDLQRPPKKKIFVKCPKCGKSISGGNPSFLKTHMDSHTRMENIKAGLLQPKKPHEYVCDECGKICKTINDHQLHCLAHLGPSSWEFMCSMCSKKCISKYKLEEHMRTHSKEKPFACKICKQKYAHRHNLRIHVNSKHGDVIQDVPRKCKKPSFVLGKTAPKKTNSEENSSDSSD